jgi:hypothetical protein
MWIALFITGEWRTIESCLPYLLKNLVSYHPDQNVRVFFCLQTNDGLLEKEAWLRSSLGSAFGSLIWFDPSEPHWITTLNSSVQRLQGIGNQWVDYLAYRSGSIIEYYQLWLAYPFMESYETSHGILFDFVIRSRSDVLLCKPLVPWLHWRPDEWNDHWNRLLGLDSMMDAVPITYAMNSLVRSGPFKCEGSMLHNCDPLFYNWSEFKNYLLTGKYALTYRKNIIYIVPRKYFNANIGIRYGSERISDNAYWFDAESQLQSHFYHHLGLSVFDSVSWSEGKSLYSYKRSDYWNEDGSLRNLPDCLFFLLRNV